MANNMAGGSHASVTDQNAAAFRCGIQLPAGGPSIAIRPPAIAARAWPPSAARPSTVPPMPPPSLDGTHIRASVGSTTEPDAALYHRVDDGPRAGRRRRPPPLPGPPALGAAPCARGRRGRGLARRTGGWPITP